MHDFQLQQVENTQELVTHFQNQTNLLAISLIPIDQDEIIKLISSGLLEKIYFLTELPTSTQLLNNVSLRLDSKYGYYKENIANLKMCFLKIRLFFYQRSKGQIDLHEVYAVKGKLSALQMYNGRLVSFLKLEGHPRSQIMGRWTSDLGLELFNHKSMYERRKNMSGITLGNTVLPWAPLSIVKEDVNSNVHLSGNLEKKCHTTHYPKLCILGDTSGLV